MKRCYDSRFRANLIVDFYLLIWIVTDCQIYVLIRVQHYILFVFISVILYKHN